MTRFFFVLFLLVAFSASTMMFGQMTPVPLPTQPVQGAPVYSVMHPFGQSFQPVMDSLYEPNCPNGEQGLVTAMYGQVFYLLCPNDPRPRWLGSIQTAGSISAVTTTNGDLFVGTYAGELVSVVRGSDGRLETGTRWPTAFSQGLVGLGNRHFLVASENGVVRYRIRQDGEIATPALPPAAKERVSGCTQVHDPGPVNPHAFCVSREGDLLAIDKALGALSQPFFAHPQLRSVVVMEGAIYGLLAEDRQYQVQATVGQGQVTNFAPALSRLLAPGSIIRIDFGNGGKLMPTKVSKGDLAPVGSALVLKGKIVFTNEHWDGGVFSGYSIKVLDPKTGIVSDLVSQESLRRVFGAWAYPGPFFVLPSMPTAK